MGELILHIGTTKTGTTSLQSFLSTNRKRLEQHGIAFPTFTRLEGTSLARNAFFLNRYCLNLAKQGDFARDVEGPQENLERLSDCLCSYGNVLLSDEVIYNYSKKARAVTGGYWATMARILAAVGADGVKVVLYLRRQDDWISSAWRQSIKTGHCDKQFSTYYSRPSGQRSMDYASTTEAIERAFDGAARIIVRRYDRRLFEGGDIYHDFCSATGIPWDAGYRIPESDHNPSLSFDVAEAIRTFADAAPMRTPLRTGTLIPLAQKLTVKYPDAPGTTPFDEEATRALMEPYLEGNRLISERYLDGAPLFSEEYGGRPVWAPDEERIAECRAAFEEAIEQYKPPSGIEKVANALARKMSKSIKRSLRAIRERLSGR